ncbi:hypothetical protein [Streptomyces sp. NPDC000880]
MAQLRTQPCVHLEELVGQGVDRPWLRFGLGAFEHHDRQCSRSESRGGTGAEARRLAADLAAARTDALARLRPLSG